MTEKTKLTHTRSTFRPFNYPWAFDAWERHESAHWLPKEIPLHDDMKDWDKLPQKDRDFLTNVFRFFVQGDCYHKDTDILTTRGFVKFPELKESDLVAQVKYEDGEFKSEFVKPERIVIKPFKGDLLLIGDNRRRTKQCITPTHNIVYTSKGKLVKEKANEALIYQGKKFHNSVNAIGVNDTLTSYDRLKIAFQADGNVKEDVDGSRLGYIPHRFAFKKLRKVERLKQILHSCGLEFEETIDAKADGDYFVIYVKGLTSKLSKTFDWVDLSEISSNWCKEFLNEVVEWDGTKSEENRYYYFNTNKEAFNIAHSIAVMAGVTLSKRIKPETRSENHNDGEVLSWRNDEYQSIDGQSIRNNLSKIAYDDNVYCVTVPSGMIVTRFDGCTAISGNCDVADGYVRNYLPYLPQPEVRMMLLSFAAREAVHIVAYSHLIESLGMPETIYDDFLKYKEMADKHEYFKEINALDKNSMIQQIAAISAFTEGVQLFSSFAMLLNYTRFGKMKGMGQIITWSILDETMHCEGAIKLFRTFVEENRAIWKDELKSQIYTIAENIVRLEDNFIDLCFSTNDFQGLTKEDLKAYIRYIADRRLIQMGLKGIFKVRKNPLPWIDEIVNAPIHGNFFENKVTDYAKGATTGSWGDVWGSLGLPEG